MENFRYYEKPDYARINILLHDAIRINDVSEYPYDWEKYLKPETWTPELYLNKHKGQVNYSWSVYLINRYIFFLYYKRSLFYCTELYSKSGLCIWWCRLLAKFFVCNGPYCNQKTYFLNKSKKLYVTGFMRVIWQSCEF